MKENHFEDNITKNQMSRVKSQETIIKLKKKITLIRAKPLLIFSKNFYDRSTWQEIVYKQVYKMFRWWRGKNTKRNKTGEAHSLLASQ